MVFAFEICVDIMRGKMPRLRNVVAYRQFPSPTLRGARCHAYVTKWRNANSFRQHCAGQDAPPTEGGGVIRLIHADRGSWLTPAYIYTTNTDGSPPILPGHYAQDFHNNTV